MSIEEPHLQHASDGALIDLLRVESGLGINDLASALGVTATAVRQRLDRLIRDGIVEKGAGVSGPRRSRGRPAHSYGLTGKGRQLGGDNFRDLAMVLWREIREVREPQVRRGLFNRIGEQLAGLYRDAVHGETPADRLESVASMLREREIPCSVGVSGPAEASSESPRRRDRPVPSLPVLTSHACPYPQLAEQDRGICAAERLMLEQLVGAPVKLSECRLDGDDCCRFTVHAVNDQSVSTAAHAGHSAANPCGGVASNGVSASNF